MKITAALMVALTMVLAGCTAQTAEEAEEADRTEEATESSELPAPDLSTLEEQQVARAAPRPTSGSCNCR